MIIIENHQDIKILRDDLLPGGTKSILLPSIIGQANEYVYASPVYGGFQIALSAYCAKIGKKATIFCAKRGKMHENTKICQNFGANIIEVPCGYMTVVEKRAKDYCIQNNAEKIAFGANTSENKNLIAKRMESIIEYLGNEPDEIWCAIGSGTLVEGILQGTKKAKIYGVQIGKEYQNAHPRLNVMKYHKTFDKKSKFKSDFPSMPHYDLKAFEYCVQNKKSENVLFWNVL